jgi:hypothetical protein
VPHAVIEPKHSPVVSLSWSAESKSSIFGLATPPMLGTLRAAYQLRQRLIVEPMKHVAKLLGVDDPLGEMLAIGSAQRADQCVAVLGQAWWRVPAPLA